MIIRLDKYLADMQIGTRKEVKELIKRLKRTSPNIDEHIFKALDNINLNCVLGTKKNGEYHSFLDDYEEK